MISFLNTQYELKIQNGNEECMEKLKNTRIPSMGEFPKAAHYYTEYHEKYVSVFCHDLRM